MTERPALPGGIYPPLPTFFTDSEELDLDSLRRHIRRRASDNREAPNTGSRNTPRRPQEPLRTGIRTANLSVRCG